MKISVTFRNTEGEDWHKEYVEERLSKKFSNLKKVRCILRPEAKQQAVNGHLVKEALKMGGRIVSVEIHRNPSGGNE